MIKYFKLKSNGDVCKTPLHFESINRELCYEILQLDRDTIRFTFSNLSLFEIYLKVTQVPETEVGNFLINKEVISFDELKSIISAHVEVFKKQITLKIIQLENEIKKSSEEYSQLNGTIEFDCFERDTFLEKYKELKSDLRNLRESRIHVIEYDDHDNISFKKDIIPDIFPVKV